MNKFKITFLAAILFTISQLDGFSQLSISYYSSTISKIGLGYNFQGRVWTELRIYSYTSVDYFTPELALCYNFVKKENYNAYFGLGANTNYFKGIILPLGVQFTPFEKANHFSLHIEFSPDLDFKRDDIIIQSSWGIRYRFGK